MPRFSASGGGLSEDEASDSEYRRKRRKVNHAPQHFQDGGPQPTAKAQPAAPNSFAAKMMAKMGYVEGQGLGAAGKGRLAPVDAQVRPQGVGLGVVKEKTKQAKQEEKREAGFRGQVIEDSSEEERKRKKERKERNRVGTPGGTSVPRAQPKQKYRTAGEIEAAAEGLEIPNVLKSIIDATGHETRLLSSTAGLLRAQDAMIPAETEALKLSRMAQRESVAFAEEWRALQERKEFFEAQESQLQKSVSQGESEDSLLNDLIMALERLHSVSFGNESSWETTIREIEAVAQQVNSKDDYLDIQEAAVAAIHPLFKQAMLDWEPFENVAGCSSYLERIREILRIEPISTTKELVLQNGDGPKVARNKSTTPYESMIYTLWLPVVRSAISSWDVYNPSQLIPLIDAWRSILPQFILANVLDQLVEQRLVSAISNWKPKRRREGTISSTSPNKWLFPWFQYLDEQHTTAWSSNGLLADVKRKLKSSFSTWNIATGVFPELEQWQSVFKLELPHMLVRHILPRLAEYFAANFDVDPADQDMKPFEKVLQWIPYFSIEATAQLFTNIFFKKWHDILYLWLINQPDHSEIMQWYQWWKQKLQDQLPTGFNQLPVIAACWEKGLNIINVALDAIERQEDVATKLQPVMIPDHVQEAEPTPKPATPILKHVEIPTTFKDVVEDWCAENGLLMFPMREADLETGLPLFRITASASGKGGVVLYLKGDVAWVRTMSDGQKTFVPNSLDDALIARAEG